jgi:hypothetical protein
MLWTMDTDNRATPNPKGRARRMISSKPKPQHVAIENVVFVAFRAHKEPCCSESARLDRLTSEGMDAVSTYRQTIMRTRELARRGRELTRELAKLAGAQTNQDAAQAADLLQGQDSGGSFPARSRA